MVEGKALNKLRVFLSVVFEEMNSGELDSFCKKIVFELLEEAVRDEPN